MRVDIPGTSDYFVFRDKLTGGDRSAYQAVQDRLNGLDVGTEVEVEDDDGMEVSEDGLTMVPKARPKEKVRLTRAWLTDLRDTVLGRVLTEWSFTDLPLPYVPAHWDELPLEACEAIDTALKGVTDRLRGPKAAPTSRGSASSSEAATASSLPA